MKKIISFSLICLLINVITAQNPKQFLTHFEKSGGTETETYQEVIAFFKNLSNSFQEISIQEMGKTDSGEPLHIVVFSKDPKFKLTDIRKNKRVLLINNGIHPGETDGIDATMLLYRNLAQGKIKAPKNTVLVTIPIYNIGGSLNRNTGSRANQNGPKEYGFRGNARNYDLNRDFIKCDTENAKSFTDIFHLVKPDVFIDNHVSNGADYQYALTHLFTQHNKLGGNLGAYLNEKMMPSLEEKLAKKDWDITPYVNVFNQVPEIGFSQFMDYPRYSTGYTALWNVFGMMVETHMLKPYKQRVEGTYELLRSMIEITEEQGEKIATLRQQAFQEFQSKKTYALDWEIDSVKTTTLNFKGFEGQIITSEVTGLKRLKYDRNKPFTKKVVYQNYFKPKTEITIPKAYIIPQGWHQVIDLFQRNQVQMTRIEKDTTLTVSSYKIAAFETRKDAYEGHYQHYNTTLTVSSEEIGFRKGDYLINTNQQANRYVVATLEPQGPDSFFNWNFFDTILQKKEGFSPYIFEDTAKDMLANNSELKATFQKKKENDSSFSENWYAQLNWLYERSNHAEKAYMQYPIYRLN